jgi:hypothetical protein
MTYEQMLKEAQEEFEKVTKEFNLNSNPYVERDKAVMQLAAKFYDMTGLGVTGSFELLTTCEDSTKARKLARTIKGWTVWQGEETEIIWKDGDEKGKMDVSCRGGSYIATCDIGRKSYKATDDTQPQGQWTLHAR